MNKQTGTAVVPIEVVINACDSSRRQVVKMADVLRRQGQIEPLQVQVYAPDVYITWHQDVHGNDIVQAAKLLGWPTLLVTVVNRFEG